MALELTAWNFEGGKNSSKQNEAHSVTDDELIAHSTAGDGMSSFDELYRRYHRRVFCICLKMTSNVADAEDLAQDVFIQVQRNLRSFRGEATFASWLHRITVNQVLMKFRKKSNRSELITDDGEMPDVVLPSTERPSHMPIFDQIALVAAIDKLAPGYRKIFLLHDVEGHEHEEIAKKLGISAGTSKSQLHKARMKLRSILLERAGQVEKSNKGIIRESTIEKFEPAAELLAA